MKVLFVCAGNGPFGIMPFIRSQGESLRAQGVEVDFWPLRGRGAAGYLRNLFRLRRHLRRHPVDLVHAHYGLCGFVARLARRREKLVVSFMGDDLLGSVGRGGAYTLGSRLLVWMARRLVAPRCDQVVVKSESMRARLPESVSAAVIPNGVDFDLFQPVGQARARAELGLAGDRPLVVFAAAPHMAHKNYALAQRAVALLGDGAAELRAVHGQPQETLCLWFNAADCLLLTSRHEGSPNVVKEAMACNCPVVATDVGDVRQIVGSTDGCHVTSFDAAEVAAGLRQVLARRQRTNGRDRIGHLRLEQVAARVADLYRRVLGQG